jgi:flagellar biosynthesis protein FlhA
MADEKQHGPNRVLGKASAMMAIGLIGILMVMMIPLPAFILDILLSFNIAVSIIILLMSLYIVKPLDFSTFPSILLIVTLMRLSLNVCRRR